ncbi:uncharacterized protein LOC116340414 [Contarinia nasturtii]|uniref:uncharacterized protein LOC116340414 n=1 Tax=Contarinia nasturtii TaxID=265458 RepID=UPI0012D398B3|nr:uncharacterized protein LOC116340414 [Contarinia nasturtii]
MDPLVMMVNLFDEYSNEFTTEYKGRIVNVKLYTENGVDIPYRARLMNMIGYEFEVLLIENGELDMVDLNQIERNSSEYNELESFVRRLQEIYNQFHQYFRETEAVAYSEENNIWNVVQLMEVLWSSDRPCEFVVEDSAYEEKLMLASNVRCKELREKVSLLSNVNILSNPSMELLSTKKWRHCTLHRRVR